VVDFSQSVSTDKYTVRFRQQVRRLHGVITQDNMKRNYVHSKLHISYIIVRGKWGGGFFMKEKVTSQKLIGHHAIMMS
jgi:hypothetical protein